MPGPRISPGLRSGWFALPKILEATRVPCVPTWIRNEVGRPVYFDLHVRTVKDWQSDPKALARLGF